MTGYLKEAAELKNAHKNSFVDSFANQISMKIDELKNKQEADLLKTKQIKAEI